MILLCGAYVGAVEEMVYVSVTGGGIVVVDVI